MHHPRQAPLQLARKPARCVPPFHPRERGEAPPRPDGRLQAQQVRVASGRRPRLAYRVGTVSGAQRRGVVACQPLRLPLGQRTASRTGRGTHLRRFLHATRDCRDSGLRRPAAHRGHPRHRTARTLQRRSCRLPFARLQRTAVHGGRGSLLAALCPALRRQRLHTPVPQQPPRRDFDALPLRIYPHRMQPGMVRQLGAVPQMPGQETAAASPQRRGAGGMACHPSRRRPTQR